MRVLFLTSAYPSSEAPAAGVFVREHASAAATRADVAVVHLDRSDAGSRIRLARIPDPDFPAWRVTYPARPLPVSLLAHALATVAGYRRARFHPDVLHAHFFLAGVPAAALGAIMRKPVVVTEQWSIFLPSDPMPLRRTLLAAARYAYEHAELVLPSSAALQHAIEAQGIRARFRVVPNVVDTARFHPGERGESTIPRLLAVGLLYDAKGYEYLLEAVAVLDREGRRLRLDIVGDGPLRGELERLTDALSLRHCVTFVGMQPKDAVPKFMRQADAFVLASRYENNPSALVEALASGLPVVASDVGGIPELVDDSCGLLARPQDALDLARRLAELLDRLDRYDRRAIADAAAARFGRDRVGALLAEAYGDATALRRRRR